jgi:hypothetical protein
VPTTTAKARTFSTSVHVHDLRDGEQPQVRERSSERNDRAFIIESVAKYGAVSATLLKVFFMREPASDGHVSEKQIARKRFGVGRFLFASVEPNSLK